MTRWVGPAEVAELLKVKRNTIDQWRHRGLLPKPTRVISNTPIWNEKAILEWAKGTGREVIEPSK